MARLLVNGEWYESLASTAYYEAEYERLILEQSEMLYPHHRMVSFRPTLASDGNTAKPDFALIAKDYASWFVVEVGTGTPPIERARPPADRGICDGTVRRP